MSVKYAPLTQLDARKTIFFPQILFRWRTAEQYKRKFCFTYQLGKQEVVGDLAGEAPCCNLQNWCWGLAGNSARHYNGILGQSSDRRGYCPRRYRGCYTRLKGSPSQEGYNYHHQTNSVLNTSTPLSRYGWSSRENMSKWWSVDCETWSDRCPPPNRDLCFNELPVSRKLYFD
jgi:hypothetical protein